MCNGIFNQCFVANFTPDLQLKVFIDIGQHLGLGKKVCFLESLCAAGHCLFQEWLAGSLTKAETVVSRLTAEDTPVTFAAVLKLNSTGAVSS